MKNHRADIPSEDLSGENLTEFFSLIEEKLAGTISKEGLARIELYLRQNKAAFDYYVALYKTESRIPEVLALGEKHTTVPESRPPSSKHGNTRPIPFLKIAVGATALASAVAIGFILPLVFRSATPLPTETSQVPVVFCRVSQVLGASFEGQRIEPQTELKAETFSIDTGIAELIFAQGTRVLLESPASLTITGANSCRLAYGKAVADVPKAAKGFIMEGPNDRAIDYGTRFGMNVSRDGSRTLLGVLNGIVDLEHKGETVRLFTNYAVERQNDSIKSVPFEKDEFLTEMPLQEYTWNIDGLPFEEISTLRFDVTHLIKTPGEIHVIFKWLLGQNGLLVKKLTLEQNGSPVLVSDIPRRAGRALYTHDNIFPLTLPASTPLTGKWELVVAATCTKLPEQKTATTATSRGIFLFEKGLHDGISANDFLGRWQFSHDDKTYIREIKSDGTAGMTVNGVPRDFGDNPPRWSFNEGVLTIDFLREGWGLEQVVLRDKDTMIFLNQVYRNAQRMK
ncbi:MAG: FecR domain-containing protein [Puniceicoccales bacterium]|jgi:hypothetical protein|nr:FecR domain-containing protein [Puniceicoccales bacterium]